MENLIQVIAGRPGAGKTSWVSQEITALAKDKNNIIIFIGREEEYEQIVQGHELDDSHRQCFGPQYAGMAIGRAIDLANELVHEPKPDETATRIDPMIYLFYDQCRCDIFRGFRDILEAAAKAGVRVCVTCQTFDQVDKGNVAWLKEHCRCMIVSKHRPPRDALPQEIEDKYREMGY